MSSEFTFCICLVASGIGNRYCMCGGPLAAAGKVAVHVTDSRGFRRVCDTCALHYAPSLAKMIDIEPRDITVEDILRNIPAGDYPRWVLSPQPHVEREVSTTVLEEVETLTLEEYEQRLAAASRGVGTSEPDNEEDHDTDDDDRRRRV